MKYRYRLIIPYLNYELLLSIKPKKINGGFLLHNGQRYTGNDVRLQRLYVDKRLVDCSDKRRKSGVRIVVVTILFICWLVFVL